MKRGEQVMADALNVINGERQDAYGNPEDCFKTIAKMWSAYLYAKGLTDEDQPLSAADVAQMMSLLKIAREAAGNGKRDNYIDLIGYTALAHDIQYGQEDDNGQEDARR